MAASTVNMTPEGSCERANRAHAEPLLGATTSVILMVRTAVDATGRVVEISEMTTNASRYILEYDFTS
ncbi:hypothetical protein [Streptomyces colonosanans]|nr:hypothetical protein [Streptomyces colonosanans]